MVAHETFDCLSLPDGSRHSAYVRGLCGARVAFLDARNPLFKRFTVVRQVNTDVTARQVSRRCDQQRCRRMERHEIRTYDRLPFKWARRFETLAQSSERKRPALPYLLGHDINAFGWAGRLDNFSKNLETIMIRNQVHLIGDRRHVGQRRTLASHLQWILPLSSAMCFLLLLPGSGHIRGQHFSQRAQSVRSQLVPLPSGDPTISPPPTGVTPAPAALRAKV